MVEPNREHVCAESDPSNQQRDQDVHRVSKRITEELPKDIAVLAEHRPAKLEELREIVCKEADEE